mmetsp:Transcript_16246/g.24378  ORF Transcript_16246/g.24378 Transcript_16246/m.24378 type:complete len:91 (+) Transcript_16246:688-960(+)
MRDQSNDGSWGDSEFPMKERILCSVVGRGNWFFHLDSVDDHGSRNNIKNLHDGIVNGVKCCEKVKVPGHEYKKEELMRADRYSCGILDDT